MASIKKLHVPHGYQLTVAPLRIFAMQISRIYNYDEECWNQKTVSKTIKNLELIIQKNIHTIKLFSNSREIQR